MILTSSDVLSGKRLLNQKPPPLNKVMSVGGGVCHLLIGSKSEIVCEAAPPKHGYLLTEKGKASDMYKKAKNDFEKTMEEWCGL